MATKNRKTIGINPLDAVVPDLRGFTASGATTSSAPTASDETQTSTSNTVAANPDQARENTRKERLTIHLSSELIERIKNAVFWTPGLTLAELGETALSRMVEELESQRGEPFAPRSGELKGGRPLKRQ